ncbi:MAG: PqqD family protein [Candidatus Aminicenantes bacterium]|nr:MAG: PqqD family protein [Candidatus Aminicenantes bacterium]
MKNEKNKRRQINLLDLIPVRNIDWKKEEDGLIVLLKPKFKNPLLVKHVLPRLKKPYYKIKLDDVGSALWELCDGTLTVEKLAERMKDRFGEKIEPLYDRLALFLQNLERNRLIKYK